MDELDRRILTLLGENARMTVKEIARRVSLTSPAVSERIRRLERTGVISGYTVVVNPNSGRDAVQAVISMYVRPAEREDLVALLRTEEAVRDCLQVTGELSHMIRVTCRDIPELDALLGRLQKLGRTNTQIVLTAPIQR